MSTETPPNKSRTPLMFGVIIVVLIVALGAVFFFENNQITGLQSNLAATNSSLQTMTSMYSTLSSNYSSLNTQYNSLQSNYTGLNSQYNTLNGQYNTLNGQYSTLQSNYATLNSQYLSEVNDTNTYEAIANMSMTQTLAPWPSSATSSFTVAPYGQILTFSIPYSGYLTVQFQSTDKVMWVFSNTTITSTFWQGTNYVNSMEFPAWQAPPSYYYTNYTFNMPVIPGTLYILIANDGSGGTISTTYSITYHY